MLGSGEDMIGGIFSIKRVVTQQDIHTLLESQSLWLLSWVFTDIHLEKRPRL